MLYLLAIDPGVETGIALLSGEGTIVWTLTTRSPHSGLSNALNQYHDASVVIEEAPLRGHYKHAFLEVRAIVEHNAANYERSLAWVLPSHWKGSPRSRLDPAAKAMCTTKHEREAVGLGRWYLSQRSRDDKDN